MARPLTLQEAADTLGCSPNTIRRLMDRGHLEFSIAHRPLRYVITPDALDAARPHLRKRGRPRKEPSDD